MFLHTWHPHQLLTTIGGIELHWYGLGLAAAALVSIALVEWLGKKHRLDTNRLFDLTLITIVAGFIGARFYHVLNEWTYYQLHPIEAFQVWHGGLALHGGLLFGAVTVILLARRWKMNAWLVLDILAPAMAIAQAIGRWGNYFNQELFGRPTELPWGIPIDTVNRPADFLTRIYFHPTFFYESVGLLLIAMILLIMHHRQWRQEAVARAAGTITLVYLGLASLLRGANELLRIDRTPIIGGIRLPILVSGALFIATILLLIIRYRRTHATRS